MGDLPRISQAEWEVMKVLWERAPLSASEVAAALGQRRWSHRTVKTLLGRLVAKGALDYQVQGKRYLYRPRVNREQCIRRESRSFLDRVFAGQPGAMLVHFVRHARLSPEEVRHLRRLLRQKRKE
jgi:BlaI family penicillinase repressor